MFLSWCDGVTRFSANSFYIVFMIVSLLAGIPFLSSIIIFSKHVYLFVRVICFVVDHLSHPCSIGIFLKA